MGRTYEALSHGRVKRAAVDIAAIPPTVITPVFLPTPNPETEEAAESDVAANHSTADTVPQDDLSKDNDTIPFIEVGGPRGSKPRYGPMVENTPLPNAGKLRIDPMTAPTPLPTRSEGAIPTVAFFPLPEHAVPDAHLIAAELIAFHSPDHPVSAQYRAVLAGLSAQHPGVGCPLLVFTTVGQPAEAATVILNAAITRAREENKRLLVIEANHAQPLVAGRLGVADRPGLRELLNRAIPMSAALQPTAQKGLYVLPPGDPEIPVSQEAESRLPGTIDHLRKRFDWLLVNGPEWGSGGSGEWVGLGDAAYLIVRRDQWDSPEVETAHRAILDAGGKLRGYLALQFS